MNKIAPFVTIVVPSFNHDKYIKKCIDSIVNQTYNNFELIVIDDGSKDRSKEILLQLREKYNFELVFQENLGLANTLNRGFKELAKGKYLTFCASDDYWLPEKLENQIKFMEANSEFAMVYGKVYIVDNKDNILLEATHNANKNLKGGYIFNDLILLKYHPPVNYLFRTSIFKRIGYYDSSVWAEDFDMNLNIALNFKIGFIDEFLSFYRRDVSGKAKMLTFKTINSHKRSIDKYKHLSIYREAVGRWRLRNFIWYCSYKESKLFAAKNMLLSLKYFHSSNYLRCVFKLLLKWD